MGTTASVAEIVGILVMEKDLLGQKKLMIRMFTIWMVG